MNTNYFKIESLHNIKIPKRFFIKIFLLLGLVFFSAIQKNYAQCTAPNLALSGTASASSQAFGGYPAAAIDGSTTGDIHHSANETNPSWQVDLGTNATISEIVVYLRAAQTVRFNGAIVEVLNASNGVVFSNTVSSPAATVTIPVTDVTGQKVRIRLVGSNRILEFFEVQVFSSENDIDGDGVSDSCDKDNDNDGILDSVENPCNLAQTGSWTASGSIASSAAASTGISMNNAAVSGNTSLTYVSNNNFNTNNFWSNPSVAGDTSLEFSFRWDTTPTSNQGNTATNNAGTRTVTLTFSKPTYKAVLHVDRLGGAGANNFSPFYSNSSEWTLTTTNVRMARLSGNTQFEVVGNKFFRTPNVNVGNSEPSGNANNSTGTAAGSIEFSSITPITEVTFSITGIGVEGDGLDFVEFILESCETIDTDNDGIPNYLDLDSDNDGCSDAVEGGTTTNQTSNYQFPASPNVDGVSTAAASYNGNTNYINAAVTSCSCPLASGIDSDGDGIDDTCDLDDDNDGILDENEGVCPTLSQKTVFLNNRAQWLTNQGSYILKSDSFQGDGSVSGAGVYTSTTNPGLQVTSSTNPASGYIPTDFGFNNGLRFRYTANTGNDGDLTFSHIIKLPQEVYGVSFTHLDWFDVTFTKSRYEIYVNGVLYFRSNLDNVGSGNSSGNVNVNHLSNGTLVSGSELFGNFTTVSPERQISLISDTPFSSFEIRVFHDDLIEGNNIRESDWHGIDDLEWFSCTPLDTDGDGTPDHLDSDSDNDGCFDAIEGADNILITAIDGNGKLTGTVSNKGVPNNVNPTNGQGIGNSIDTSTRDANGQCDIDNDGVVDSADKCDGFDDALDNDSDGIPDGCDLDDDNDGITDVNEGAEAKIWDVDGTNLTLTSGGQTSTMTFTTTSSTTPTAINSVDFFNIQEELATGVTDTYTITSTLPLRDVNFQLLGLGNRGAAVTGSLGNFIITLADGTVINDADFKVMYGRVPDSPFNIGPPVIEGVLKKVTIGGKKYVQDGTDNSTSTQTTGFLQFPNEEALNKGIVSIKFDFFGTGVHPLGIQLQSKIRKDTDGDGILDDRDLDSDNDGCFDAIEGADNLLITAIDGTGKLKGTPDATTGVPNNVNTTTGQTVGTSIDASAKDSFGQCDSDGDGVIDKDDKCPGFNDAADNDGDLIPDGCDLDDDNDGILDTNECTGPQIALSVEQIGATAVAGADGVNNTVTLPYTIPPGSNRMVVFSVTFERNACNGAGTNYANSTGATPGGPANIIDLQFNGQPVTQQNAFFNFIGNYSNETFLFVLNESDIALSGTSGNVTFSNFQPAECPQDETVVTAVTFQNVRQNKTDIINDGVYYGWQGGSDFPGSWNPNSSFQPAGTSAVNNRLYLQYHKNTEGPQTNTSGTSHITFTQANNAASGVPSVSGEHDGVSVQVTSLGNVAASTAIDYGPIIGYAGSIYGLELVTVGTGPSCQDTDGDSVPDYLDTDSDNDGCPDAIEAAGNFQSSNLVNPGTDDSLGDTVETDKTSPNYGVPIINGSTAQQANTVAVLDDTNKDACLIDLSLTKTIDKPIKKVGETIVFTLTLKNEGDSDATNVMVKDLLPTALTYNALLTVAPANTNYTASTGIWDLSSVIIKKGETKVLKIGATVNAAGTIITNKTEIFSTTETDKDSTNNNNN